MNETILIPSAQFPELEKRYGVLAKEWRKTEQAFLRTQDDKYVPKPGEQAELAQKILFLDQCLKECETEYLAAVHDHLSQPFSPDTGPDTVSLTKESSRAFLYTQAILSNILTHIARPGLEEGEQQEVAEAMPWLNALASVLKAQGSRELDCMAAKELLPLPQP